MHSKYSISLENVKGAYNVFTGHLFELFYISISITAPDRAERGPEFCLKYLIDYTIGFIIITS